MKLIKNEFSLVAFLLLTTFGAVAQQRASVHIPEDIEKLLKAYTCIVCHKVDAKLVGPAYIEVARKNYKDEQMVDLIYNPKPANWPGYPPMTPMKHVPKTDALKIAKWINSLNKKSKTAPKKWKH